MRHLLLKARKDPQNTAGLSVLAILGIGALILYAAYVRRPPAQAPAFSILPPNPATRPTTRENSELLTQDSLIIQANSAQLERRRMALEEARMVRALERGRINPGRRPPPPQQRSVLQRLFRPDAATTARPTTLPTTQASR